MNDALAITAAAGAALVAGVLHAFSTFAMTGLRRLPDDRGAAAMQAINLEAPTSRGFMIPFVGTALLSIGLATAAVTRLGDTDARYQVGGAVLYLVCIGLTAGYHQPRNVALGRVDATTPAGAGAWRAYAPGWTAWNHVRVACALAGSVLFMLAVNAS